MFPWATINYHRNIRNKWELVIKTTIFVNPLDYGIHQVLPCCREVFVSGGLGSFLDFMLVLLALAWRCSWIDLGWRVAFYYSFRWLGISKHYSSIGRFSVYSLLFVSF